MKLLREITEAVEYVIESVAEKKKHYITGPFIECDIKNRNGRLYRLENTKPEVDRYTNEMVKNNRAVGEMGHPSGPQINGDRVAIKIENLIQDKSQFIGKASIVETPMGNIVKGLLESEVKLGVSSRALGTLKEDNGAMVVQSDLKLIAIDVVMDPSAPNAWVESIQENVEWVFDPKLGWKACELVEQTKKKMKKMNVNAINENKVRLFESFLASIVIK